MIDEVAFAEPSDPALLGARMLHFVPDRNVEHSRRRAGFRPASNSCRGNLLIFP